MSIPIFIASFGYKDIIKKIIEEKNIDHHFKDVLTPGIFDDYEDGIGMIDKNRMIEFILKKYGFNKPFLVDDSGTNIKNARKEGYLSYHISYKGGINDNDANNIIRIIETDLPDVLILDADETLFKEHVTCQFIYKMIKYRKDLSTFNTNLVHLGDGVSHLLTRIFEK